MNKPKEKISENAIKNIHGEIKIYEPLGRKYKALKDTAKRIGQVLYRALEEAFDDFINKHRGES